MEYIGKTSVKVLSLLRKEITVAAMETTVIGKVLRGKALRRSRICWYTPKQFLQESMATYQEVCAAASMLLDNAIVIIS